MISDDPNAIDGDAITFIAEVQVPSEDNLQVENGFVTFAIDGVAAGSASIEYTGNILGYAAEFAPYPVLAHGKHVVTATYAGSSDFAPSTGTLMGGQDVGVGTITTASVSPSGTAPFNESVTLTATVKGVEPGEPVPTGTVTFFDQETQTSLGAAPLVEGVASLATAFAAPGNNDVLVTYSGDTNDDGSHYVFTVNVAAAPTITTLSSTARGNIGAGQPVSFVATVSEIAPGTYTPSGNVEFFDQTTGYDLGDVQLLNGSAKLETTSLGIGEHSIVAEYQGETYNSLDLPSNSLPQGLTVLPATTTSLGYYSSPNPAVVGQNVELYSFVSWSGEPTYPTGTVTFTEGSTVLGSASLAYGEALINVPFATAGPHMIAASYGGDSTDAASVSSPVGLTINQDLTATYLSASSNQTTSTQPITLTANVSALSPGAGSPGGSVAFFDGSTLLGKASLDGGDVATYTTTTTLSPGYHYLTAVYGGDGNFATSTSYSVEVQSIANPTLTLTAPQNTLVYGQSMTLTSTLGGLISGVDPTGTVTFYDGTNTLATVALAHGTASLSGIQPTAGYHSFGAFYSGDQNYEYAYSQPFEVKVQPDGSLTELAVSSNPSIINQPVTLTAIVKAHDSDAGVPSGEVSFYDGTAVLATVPVIAGQATYTTSSLALGLHDLNAQLTDDPNFVDSTSTDVYEQIIPASVVEVTLASSVNPALAGENVALTSEVSYQGGVGGSFSGDVTFTDGNVTLGSAPVVDGTASLTVSLSPGSHTLSALYSGDTTNPSAQSPSIVESVVSSFSYQTLTSLASTGDPVTLSGLVEDAAGDLFGTTSDNFAGTGTLYEIPAGSISANNLLQLPGRPSGNLVIDSQGDVFGATSTGTAGGGSVCELVANGGGFKILASFGDGETPDSLVIDPAGDLFGTSSTAGDYGAGTVFEIALNSYYPQVLASFDGAGLGGTPYGLTIDTSGNLFGTTESGGDSGTGTIFEVPAGTNQILPLASFTPLDVGPKSSPVIDASGDIFGTTLNGGVKQAGSIFELAANAAIINTTYSFDPPTGANPSALTIDASGNLFGTTATGGALGNGTIFELAAGASTPVTLGFIVDGAAEAPPSGLVVDTSGNLFGATSTQGLGSVFEMSPATQPSNLTLSDDNDTTVYGQSLNLTATVSPATATGSISFYDGTTLIGSAPIQTDGTASLQVTSLGVDTHAITAIYLGDATDSLSISPALTEIVDQATTSAFIETSTSIADLGESVTLTATIEPNDPGSGFPTGVVTFFDGTTSLGSLKYAGGGLSLTTVFATPGKHQITVAYSGDSSFAGSNSAALEEFVTSSSATSVNLTDDMRSTTINGPISFSVTVTNLFDASKVPTGSISFLDGSVLIATVPLSDGAAGYQTGFAAGLHAITAVFNPDQGFGASEATVDVLATNYTQTTILNFDAQTYGSYPLGSLIADAYGNHFGTTLYGGDNGFGSVFEIMEKTGLAKTIASFDEANGAYPESSLTVDAHGNLFGTTSSGGDYGRGTIFELTPGATTPVALVSFDGSGDSYPTNARLVLDPAGDLFGTTTYGGSDGLGSVFELPDGSTTLTTLVSFYGSNGSYPIGGLAIDANGNLFGTTASGGDQNDGTLFELTAGSFALNTLASFGDTNPGMNPEAGVVADSDGNLFGTTYSGGANGEGSVFEWQAATNSLVTLDSFNGLNGEYPLSGLTLDSRGNLFGMTDLGGPSNTGTVYELAPGSNAITTIAVLSNVGYNSASDGVVLDDQGHIFGALPYGGSLNVGAVFELSPLVIPTSISVTADANPAVFGQSITLIAKLSVAPATGIVTFMDGSSPLGTAPLLNGLAILPIGSLAVGTHTITASYSGDTGDAPSTSEVDDLEVGPANTAGTLTPSLPSVNTGQSVYFTADVTVVAPGSGVPSGLIQFMVDGNPLGSPIKSLDGTATSPVTSFTTPGVHQISYTYTSSSGNFVGVTVSMTGFNVTAPWTITSLVPPTPSTRNSAVSSLAVTFSIPIDPTSFSANAFSLTRNGIAVTGTTNISLQLVSKATYQIGNLAGITSLAGNYVFTLDATKLSNLAGSAGTGTAAVSWLTDTAAPTSTVIPLPARESTLTFPVSITASDAGNPASGLGFTNLYESTNGGPWYYWTTLIAPATTANWAGQSNTTYSFYSVAEDYAGNVQSQSPVIEASTYVPNLTSPETSVNGTAGANPSSVNTGTGLFTLNLTGTDPGGGKIEYFLVYVKVDNGSYQELGPYAIPAGAASGGTWTSSIVYQGLTDGAPHTYSFYSIGLDSNGNQQSAPTSPNVTFSNQVFGVPSALAVTSFTVEHGSPSRSFVEYLDIGFNATGSALTNIVNSISTSTPLIQIYKYSLTGDPSTKTAVPLNTGSTILDVIDHAIEINFGSGGIGGAPTSTTPDGYYEVDIKLPNATTSVHHFYRLLGDVNGDQMVDQNDLNEVAASIAESAPVGWAPLSADVTGGGTVTTIDLTLATRAKGHKLASGLSLG